MGRIFLSIRIAVMASLSFAVLTPVWAADAASKNLSREDMLKQFNQELTQRVANLPHGADIVKDVQTKFEDLLKQFPDNSKFASKAVKDSAKGAAKLIEAAIKKNQADSMPAGAERQNKQEEAKSLADEGKKNLEDSAKEAGGGNDLKKMAMMNNAENVINKELPPVARQAADDVVSKYQNSMPPPAEGPGTAPSWGDFTGMKVDPNDADSMVASAENKIFSGDTSGALADANQAVSLGGKADALALRGGLELDKGQYADALKDAQKALQKEPSNPQALAVAHFAQDRVDGVTTDGPAGKASFGAGASAGGGSGSSGGLSGGFGSAFANKSEESGRAIGISEISRSGPSVAVLSTMTGGQAQKAAQGALALRDFGSALTYVNRGLSQEPNNPALLNMRSQIEAHQHDYAGAEKDAKAGLQISPKDSALLRSLGLAQLRENDFQNAIVTANQMLELDPNDAYAYAIRGQAYGKMGKRDLMLEDMTRAAELDPNFKDALAQVTGQVQLPSDKDILFLFPGEADEAAKAAGSAAAPASRNRSFGLMVGASVVGGLLMALALLGTVLAPLKEQVSSVFTRITRTGPTVGPEIEEATPQPASSGGLVPGLIRGQYEILRQIGAGGMGQVFEGMDRSLGRRVAIKKMREELRYDQREKARFVVEAKTVAALHHPNIVDIYSIAEAGDDVFLIFEHVDGKTVHELIQASGRLEPARAAKIVRASADALEYAHERGVIHRDMKPSNVMVDAKGIVKVMDFGIARTAKDAMTRRSMTNTVVGTPPYMAPEQEQGHVRRESDVYALAVCAYEMLTGGLPFIGTGGGMLLNKINMNFTPPSRETAGLPPALDPVFARALQADPDKRYPTAAEFADALEAALSAAVRV